MPIVATDDQARRLRYIYLGPVGFRFPFDARFPAMGLAVFLTLTFVAGAFAFSPAGTRLGLLGALLSPIAAILLTRRIMRHVDHDRPLRWWAGVIQDEFRTPRPHTQAPVTRSLPTVPDLFQQGITHEAPPSLRVRVRRRARRAVRHR